MEKKTQILIVDDEVAITENLASFIERAGYSVLVAPNGKRALEIVDKQSPALIVLDVLMPIIDGREVLRQLRKKGVWTPIILLTQVGGSSERAMALEEGADDYLNKPFDPQELVARIRSVLRRARPVQPSLSASWKLKCGPLLIDRKARRISLNNEEITLTPKAFLLLEYMMIHPDELITRERLLEVVWGWEYPGGSRAVDTRIAEIRRVLQEDISNPSYIETLPGQGYRFSKDIEVFE